MSQYREGTINVDNAATDVFGVFVANLTDTIPTGLFLVDDALTFTPSTAAGTVVSYDSLNSTLKFIVSSVAQPATSDLITTTGTVTGTVNTFDFEPTFVGNVSPADIFSVTASPAVFFEVSGITTKSHITLNAPFAQPDTADANYIISTSFTTNNNIAYAEKGDQNPSEVFKRGIITIDGLIAASGIVTAVSGSFTDQLTVSGIPVDINIGGELITASGHLQTQIDAVEASDVDDVNSVTGSVTIAGAGDVNVNTAGQTITVSHVPDALVGGFGVVITSGTSTITIDAHQDEEAILGGTGITIVSGSQTTTIVGHEAEDALIGGTGVTVTSGSSTTTIDVHSDQEAIVGGTGIVVTSGSSTTTIVGHDAEDAITGSDGITITSGTNAVDVAGFRDEFVSASGVLQTAIDLVESSDVDALTVSGGSDITGTIDFVGSSGVNVSAAGNTITIDGQGIVAGGGGASNIDDINSITSGSITVAGTGQVEVTTAGQTITISGLPDVDGITVSGGAAITGTVDLIGQGTANVSFAGNTVTVHAHGTGETGATGATGSTGAAGADGAESDAILGGAGIAVTSGTSTTTIDADVIVGGTGITVTSGTNIVTIDGHDRYTRAENDAILGGAGIAIASGTSEITIDADVIVGEGANTVTSGSNTVTISGGAGLQDSSPLVSLFPGSGIDGTGDGTEGIPFVLNYDVTVNQVVAKLDTGTLEYSVAIAGTVIEGLDNQVVNTTESLDTATSANTYIKGQEIEVLISGAANAQTLRLSVDSTRDS